jgi:CheY-like chemotaxis protein
MVLSRKHLHGLRVLVVDDELEARELVADLLRICGAEVHQADALITALAFLAMHTPDVMISDIGMAEGDGYALMRRVRSLGHEQKRIIPAIALTAFTHERDRARALGAGFDVHMPKPLEPSVLTQVVFDLARARRIGAEHVGQHAP